ncbi:PH and SEC7 domain-containing protein 1 isoform X2 [Corythoichthys intestinalis]|uniref:PH and SEC7 domain-containing protein 1 isoform X2 n=1 Tax=Corythoichthys intestinalis TaxID=161448 RepID=UPI0025A62E83|nr:PH and SEC7 domain-containing protein 1 isoform X2 [Corythoichthys intestinalis]
MEEDCLGSLHLNLTDSGPWRTHDHQHLNGEGKGDVNEAIWLPRTVSCSPVAAALSFATAQWAIPDAATTERPSFATDCDSVDDIFSLLHNSFHADELERKEEHDGTDSSVKSTGNDFKPCDAAVGQQPTTQQREHSTHQLLDNSHIAVALKSDSEEKEEDCVMSVAFSTTVDSRPEEQPQDKMDALKTGCGDSSGGQTSFQGPKLVDGSQVVSGSEGCISNTVTESTEPKQTAGTPSQKVQAADVGEKEPQMDSRSLPKHCENSVHLGQPQSPDASHTSIQPVDSVVVKQKEVASTLKGSGQVLVANGEPSITVESTTTCMNGGDMDREKVCRLAKQLFQLDGIERLDVVKHLDKDNAFSRAVGEEYLKFFDFTGQTLDQALRSFLKVVILIGETQERERVLQHFAGRFHQCNPESFSSAGAALGITCALMLLNTDLHGQNVGKAMSSSKFVSNLEGMNDGENFSRDLLKSLYNSIKSEPLQWAVDEEELTSALTEEVDAPLRSKSNPFQDVPHDKAAPVVKQGFIQRKLYADIDGKRTPWGKRRWKTFYGVLKGMVLYLQKDNTRREQQTNEEVVSVHHSLAEPAADYTKKPHVFRLQTADWRVFLFQASSKMEMTSWINRINLVSALHSSPPFPAAVGSQRRFCRPILPASQSAHTLERQLQSHAGMLESFKTDLSHLQKHLPGGKKARGKEMEEHRTRAEYLHHEIFRYESYMQVLEAWKSVEKTGDGALIAAALGLFDKAMCASPVTEEDDSDEGHLTKSHSSPSLELEMAPQSTVKIKRNVSERWTYRRAAPRLNKEGKTEI